MATREEIIEKFAHGQTQGLSNNPQTSLDTPPESTRSGTQIQESYHRYASKATGVAPQPIIGSIPVPISSYTGRYPFGKNRSSDEEDEEDCGANVPALSSSYFKPRTLEGYDKYIEPVYMEGYLEKQSVKNSAAWKRRWFIMQDSKLFYYKGPLDVKDRSHEEATQSVILLDNVDSVTTAKDFGVGAFQIALKQRRYILRAESKDRMQDWLFNFQRSIAKIVSVLLHSKPDYRNRLSSSLNRKHLSRMNRSVSFDYQENTIHFGVALDGMYKGERLGSMLGADITQCVRKTTIRTSPRRASSPLSVTNLGPQSPVEILTMFPLDAFEEDENDAAISKRLLHPTVLEHENEDDASEISEGGHEEVVNEEEHKEFSDEAQTSPPERTFSPPVYTGKYIPPHLRKREVSSNTKDNCASVGRWVPPHQREGHVNRRSIDASTSLSADSLTTIATLKIKESLSQLRFEDNNSFTTGDDVHGVTSLVGVRKSMEDVCCCIPNLNMHLGHEYFHRQSIYAIFDGHCGVRAATFSSERLLPYLMEHEAFLTDARTAFEDCFRRIDKEFLHQAALEKMSDGTTAAVVLIRGNRLLSANIGDSRAVVSISGIALDVIREQTPGREDERARIERQGGWVKEERELQMSKLHSMDLSDPMIKRKAERVVRWVNIYRVNGELAVSRAIGDFDYKGEALLNYEYWAFPEGHDRTFHGDLIIPVPEFQEIEITPEVEFLIIGCDGLWDTITSQEAVDHIRQKLNEGYNAQESSHSLANLAIRSGSSDNVSVVVVKLQSDSQELGA